MRVLLIEDDRMVGLAVQQALKDAAYAVDWVADGETAIEAAQSEAYEAVLRLSAVEQRTVVGQLLTALSRELSGT